MLIEGALICAYAVGADQIFLFIRGEFPLAIERLQAALNEAYAHGAVGRDIFGSGWSIDIVVHPGAGAYICGEETALLESLEGKRGYPRIKPPFFPAAVGSLRCPTIVNNVETVCNLPVGDESTAARRSPSWGRAGPRAPSSWPWRAT